MAITNRLRDRLFWATFGVTVVITAMFCIGTWLAVEAADDRMDSHIDDDVDSIIAQYAADPAVIGIPRNDLSVFVGPGDDRAGLPVFLRDLPEDVDEVMLDGREHDLIIRRRADKTFYFVFDESDQEAYEQKVLVILWTTLTLVLIVSFWLSNTFIRRIVTPVTNLTNRILALDETGGERLDIDEAGPKDEIYHLSKSVNLFNERIRVLLQRERDFSSDVAHELRTPLMGILGAAENLARATRKEGDTTDLIDRIKRCCAQMTTMIDAFMFLARDGSNLHRYLQPVNVDDVVDEQIALLRTIAVKRGISVQVHKDDAPKVNAIPSVVSVVLGNLLSNAVNYTNEKTVDVYLTGAGIVVQDYGPGIDTRLQPAMFERFARGENSNPMGAGIGLALVKRFCEMFSWTIDVTSSHGTGTRITLTF